MKELPALRRWSAFTRRALLRLGGSVVLAPLGLSSLPASAQPGGAPEGAQSARAPEIWTSYFAIKFVWAYVDKHSVAPGEPFDLMLSTGPKRDTVTGRVEFFRVSHRKEVEQKPVWTSREFSVAPQPVSLSAATIGAAWPPALSDVDTSGWPPGYYSADFVHAGGNVRDLQIAQIVVRNPHRSGRVLVRLGTNTYQAYNAWGGHSLYPTEDEARRGTVVSFDRPTFPDFFSYDVYLARWLEALGERNGFAVDYASNFDIHRDPELIARYPLVVSGGHDEYWSKEEFDAFERRIFKLGRNVIFFGANAAYCQVRYADVNRPPDGADGGRLLVCYKRLNDPIARRKSRIDPLLLVTTLFRQAARRPESMLMGVAYQSWFPPAPDDLPHFPYIVENADAPFFAETGYRAGDVAADVVGYEWDNRDPLGDGNRLWSDRSHIAKLPAERIKVLFRGAPRDVTGKPGRAEAVYFESPAGAKVFSSGATRWVWGLGKPGFEREPFKRFNENLVKAFLV